MSLVLAWLLLVLLPLLLPVDLEGVGGRPADALPSAVAGSAGPRGDVCAQLFVLILPVESDQG